MLGIATGPSQEGFPCREIFGCTNPSSCPAGRLLGIATGPGDEGFPYAGKHLNAPMSTDPSSSPAGHLLGLAHFMHPVIFPAGKCSNVPKRTDPSSSPAGGLLGTVHLTASSDIPCRVFIGRRYDTTSAL